MGPHTFPWMRSRGYAAMNLTIGGNVTLDCFLPTQLFHGLLGDGRVGKPSTNFLSNIYFNKLKFMCPYL